MLELLNGVKISKATGIDKISILLTKLRYYGVETAAINWFTSYLANRQQVCYANGITSSIDYRNMWSRGGGYSLIWAI